MHVTLFSTKSYDEDYFREAAEGSEHSFIFHETALDATTAPLAEGSDAVCAFVNDHLDRSTIEVLASRKIRAIAMRCAGFNNVDLDAAAEHGIQVVRVPAYSPHAVAEHTLALLLALNRRLYRAYNRVREGNFSLQGLVGFDVYGRTVGVIGTGRIGQEVIRVFNGFGCKVLCYDVQENERAVELGGRYVGFDALLAASDIITLHCPLVKATHHLIDAQAIQKMRPGVTLLNTSRGGLINTPAVIEGLKSKQIGNLGIDVYEEEDNLFFKDKSSEVLQDDTFARLLTFPNVLITGHQAFFTAEALRQITETTLRNLDQIARGEPCDNRVEPNA
jgi:D-lactate dehydrogenase